MKALIVIAERCIGCRLCEIICSFTHEQVINPKKARLRVVRLHSEPIDVPIFCIQCGLCVNVCPVNALSRDPKTGAIIVNNDKCVKCKRCLQVCPYGAIILDPTTGRPLICDLCNGNPACVNVCPTGALRYVSLEEVSLYRRMMYSRLLIKTHPHA